MDAPDAEEIHQAAALDATGEWLPGIEDGYVEEVAAQMELRRLAQISTALIEQLRREQI